MTGAEISGLAGPGLVETCLTLDILPGNRMPLVENFRNDLYHLPGRMPFRGEKYSLTAAITRATWARDFQIARIARRWPTPRYRSVVFVRRYNRFGD
jgi:hypothetical protein